MYESLASKAERGSLRLAVQQFIGTPLVEVELDETARLYGATDIVNECWGIRGNSIDGGIRKIHMHITTIGMVLLANFPEFGQCRLESSTVLRVMNINGRGLFVPVSLHLNAGKQTCRKFFFSNNRIGHEEDEPFGRG
jgi:hypothetical protein